MRLILLLIAFLAIIPLGARKTTLRLGSDHAARRSAQDSVMVKGSFMVASQCSECNSGYRLDQIEFSGFDKPANSSVESFFITNNTDRTMSGVSLYIDYQTPDGRQLHKRYLRLKCNIPAGETRKADIKSWDRQKSFHFEKSNPSRSSSPFTVIFDPVAFYLRF